MGQLQHQTEEANKLRPNTRRHALNLLLSQLPCVPPWTHSVGRARGMAWGGLAGDYLTLHLRLARGRANIYWLVSYSLTGRPTYRPRRATRLEQGLTGNPEAARYEAPSSQPTEGLRLFQRRCTISCPSIGPQPQCRHCGLAGFGAAVR